MPRLLLPWASELRCFVKVPKVAEAKLSSVSFNVEHHLFVAHCCTFSKWSNKIYSDIDTTFSLPQSSWTWICTPENLHDWLEKQPWMKMLFALFFRLKTLRFSSCPRDWNIIELQKSAPTVSIKDHCLAGKSSSAGLSVGFYVYNLRVSTWRVEVSRAFAKPTGNPCFFFGGGGGSQLDKCDFPILTLGKNGGRGVHSRMCFLFSGISPRFSVYFRIKECPWEFSVL